MRHSAPECGIWSTPAPAAAASEQAAGLSISHISQRGISGSTNKRRCLWIIWSSLAVEEEGSRFWGVSKYLRARSKETWGSCSNRKFSTFHTFLIEEFLAPTIKRHCLGNLEHLEPGGVWPEFYLKLLKHETRTGASFQQFWGQNFDSDFGLTHLRSMVWVL